MNTAIASLPSHYQAKKAGKELDRHHTNQTVTKTFRFYAAHRNPEAGSRCSSIHGHRYGLSVCVQHEQVGSLTIPFSDLEDAVLKVIGPMDHSLLLYSQDPAKTMLVASGACERLYEVPFETSCENMARFIMETLAAAGLNVVSLTLQETDTSSVTVSV